MQAAVGLKRRSVRETMQMEKLFCTTLPLKYLDQYEAQLLHTSHFSSDTYHDLLLGRSPIVNYVVCIEAIAHSMISARRDHH